MHSYGTLFICNASMGAHFFMKATCSLVHCKGQCSRKPSSCNGHDPVCCKEICKHLSFMTLKSNDGSMTTIKDRFHCSCMASSLISNLFSLSCKNVWYTIYVYRLGSYILWIGLALAAYHQVWG